MAYDYNNGKMDGYGSTEPVSGFGGGDFGGVDNYPGGTTPVNNIGFDNNDFTSGMSNYVDPYAGVTAPPMTEDFQHVDNDVTGPVNLGGISNFTPVVGWIVCIDGPERGKDYQVRPGYNFIGRAENMDICIQGDDHISRERHATIAFDPKKSLFFFAPTAGKGIVYLNGEPVLSPSKLEAYDKIEIGSTTLMFVPLCCDKFSWDN